MVNVGYLGDYAINFMKNNPEDAIQKLKDKGYIIIAVYDNVVGLDHYTTYSQLHNFYKGVLSLLQEGSFACVIKVKSGLNRCLDKNLVDDILSYSEKIIVNNEKVNLSPAFKSDFVYAFHLSTLGNIASIWGKKSYFL